VCKEMEHRGLLAKHCGDVKKNKMLKTKSFSLCPSTLKACEKLYFNLLLIKFFLL
jgi:hypothetical protein